MSIQYLSIHFRIEFSFIFHISNSIHFHRNPNGENEQIWKPVTTNRLEYMYINFTCEMRSQPFWDDYRFFKDLGMPQLMTPERAIKAGFSRQ